MIVCGNTGNYVGGEMCDLCRARHHCSGYKMYKGKSKMINNMNRCDYCENRNNWECGDGYNRIRNDTLCENFKLDFDTLSDGVKKQIQKRLIGQLEWI